MSERYRHPVSGKAGGTGEGSAATYKDSTLYPSTIMSEGILLQQPTRLGSLLNNTKEFALDYVRYHPFSTPMLGLTITAVASNSLLAATAGLALTPSLMLGETLYHDTSKGVGILWKHYKAGTINQLTVGELIQQINS